MKLKDSFLIHTIGHDIYLLDTEGTTFTKLNETAAEIIGFLEKGTSESQIISEMTNKYDVSEEIITHDLELLLATLRKIGAIDDSK